MNVDCGHDLLGSRDMQLFLLLTVLRLAPGIWMTVTSFTRFVVVLPLLRNGLGTQGTTTNAVLISMALFLSFFVMAPTLDAEWTNGFEPLSKGQITEAQAFERGTEPFRK